MFIRSLFLYAGLASAASAATFPVLTYSTYLRDSFTPNAIATDSAGTRDGLRESLSNKAETPRIQRPLY